MVGFVTTGLRLRTSGREKFGKGLCTVRMSSDAMKDNKMLHVVYRVGNIEATKKYYTKCFGMKVLRERDVPDDKYTNCFLGYGSERRGEHFSIELTYNYGVEKYDLGNGFKYVGISVPDVEAAVNKVAENDGKIIDDSELPASAVAEDTDGYRFQLVPGEQRDPVSKVSYNCTNIENSIKFYQTALGMTCFESSGSLAKLGYGSEKDSTIVELVHSDEATEVGDGYGQIAISTPDVYAAADSITKSGFEVTRAPGPVPGIGTKVTAVRDPDGFKVGD